MDVNQRPDREVVREVIAATAEEAWGALFLAYEEFGIPVEEADADLRIMGNLRFVASRRLNGIKLANDLECGQGPGGYHGDTYRVEMEMRSSILPAGKDGVRVSTYLGARARNVDGPRTRSWPAHPSSDWRESWPSSWRPLLEGDGSPASGFSPEGSSGRPGP